jgi:hypothetical protein
VSDGDVRTERVPIVDGGFRFEGVAPGLHRVSVEHRDVPSRRRWSAEPRDVTVPASGEVVVTLEVAESRW